MSQRTVPENVRVPSIPAAPRRQLKLVFKNKKRCIVPRRKNDYAVRISINSAGSGTKSFRIAFANEAMKIFPVGYFANVATDIYDPDRLYLLVSSEPSDQCQFKISPASKNKSGEATTSMFAPQITSESGLTVSALERFTGIYPRITQDSMAGYFYVDIADKEEGK